MRIPPFRPLRCALLALALLVATGSAHAGAIDGIWQSRGWGLIVRIVGSQAELFQYTERTLLALGTIPLEADGFSFDGRTRLVFRPSDEGLSLSDDDATVRIDFLPLPALPSPSPFTADPVANFELFAELFAENYALFDLNDVDWTAAVDAARSSVHAATSDAALFDLLSSLLEPLGDRHVSLASDDRFFQSGTAPDAFWNDRSDDILANIAASYLDGALGRVPGDSRVRFGTIDGGRVLYVSVLDFAAAPAGQQQLPQSLDFVFSRFGGVEAAIIDLRSNGGGRTANGVAVLDRLIDGERLGWFRETRSTLDGGFTPLDEVVLEPDGSSLSTVPVALLISGQTASAADRVALVAAYLPGVTLIGSTSLGILSDTLDVVLANGWSIGMSHQRILSVGGGHFEQVGIAPDIEARLRPSDLGAGRDPAIEAAIEHFAALPEPTAERFEVGPRANGVWFDAGHSGEGWIIEVLPDGRAFVTWFTYPPAGSDVPQAWVTAVGTVSDSRIILDEAVVPLGASFGSAFREEDVRREPWGRIVFEFSSCDGGQVIYEGPDGYRAGAQRLDRLTSVPGIACDETTTTTDPTGPARFTGSWFVPGRGGEGWMLSITRAGTAFVAWFTYDAHGNQVWLVGTGTIDGTSIDFPDLLRPVGGRFGPAFDPARVERRPWGSLDLSFLDCDSVAIAYQSSDPAFGSGERVAIRLTQPLGVRCEN